MCFFMALRRPDNERASVTATAEEWVWRSKSQNLPFDYPLSRSWATVGRDGTRCRSWVPRLGVGPYAAHSASFNDGATIDPLRVL